MFNKRWGKIKGKNKDCSLKGQCTQWSGLELTWVTTCEVCLCQWPAHEEEPQTCAPLPAPCLRGAGWAEVVGEMMTMVLLGHPWGMHEAGLTWSSVQAACRNGGVKRTADRRGGAFRSFTRICALKEPEPVKALFPKAQALKEAAWSILCPFCTPDQRCLCTGPLVNRQYLLAFIFRIKHPEGLQKSFRMSEWSHLCWMSEFNQKSWKCSSGPCGHPWPF